MHKIYLKIHYSPIYTREVWHYRDSNDDHITREINQFNWERAFENKNVDEKVVIFNKTVLNILSNFIPHELIVCNEKDPSWVNSKTKSLIHGKIKTYKVICKNIGNNHQIGKLKSLQNHLKWVIGESKYSYYLIVVNELLNFQKELKAALVHITNLFKQQESTHYSPFIWSKWVCSRFWKENKTELFNSFSAKQCFLLLPDSITLPKNIYWPLNSQERCIQFNSTIKSK